MTNERRSELESLQHDTARATAFMLTDVIIAILRPEEVIECQRQFYGVMRATLDSYEQLRKGEPPTPSLN